MKKVYLAHNVCLNSSYDFNIVKNALSTNDFIIVDDISEADTCIYAGCGVRGVWVDNAIDEINTAVLKNKELKIIATGCFSAIEPKKIKEDVLTQNIQLMSFDNIVKEYTNSSIQELDKSLSQTESIDYEGKNEQRKRLDEIKSSLLVELEQIDDKYHLEISKKYKETTKGFIFYNEDEPVENITITRGCPYKCSYCSIPIGRGGEYNSVPLGDIIEKVNLALKSEIPHILLLGDEIGNYGLGTNDVNLSILLDMILGKSNLKISIRYLEPNPFLKHYETIKKYCEDGKIKLLYLPLQSGSNRILKLMNRTYEIDDDLIQKISYLKENTDVVFYTNWMVGFHSETEEDFQQTVDLAKRLNLQINMAIPFSERPNTPVMNMENKISIKVKKDRHTRLFNILKKIKRDEFEKELLLLEENERNEILDKIMLAEDYLVQID